MTADGWESRAQDDYIGITAHFCDHNFQLHRITTACRPFEETHSGDNIRRVLEEETKALQLPRNILKVFTTDSAPNMVCGRRMDNTVSLKLW